MRHSGLPALAILLCIPWAAHAQSPDFNREVRPILSQHCFKCHGPDDGQRQAGLRLDRRDAALAPLMTGDRAIVPRSAAKSALVRRILSHGPDTMPPAYANKPLTAAEKKVLSQWITAGAEYKQHWAFVPPKAAPLPVVHDKAWPRNPIDYFVLARLEQAGLKPSPAADRYTLIRRVSLDLIGLPPTPEEADAFVHDARPDAYDRLVDRLLASPHYGERWARRWLDLARYADTNGYEKDRQRSIWPYRDWVINALNRDMPFDEFTLEQLAGDMLPNATLQQRIATGFHRNTMLNEEGGIDPQEYQFYSMVDRVATTGTTWLGLTVGCAQCHTHKFDPITQRDYYRTMAFFNNTEDATVEIPTPDVMAKRRQLEAQAEEKEARLASILGPIPANTPPAAAVMLTKLKQEFTDWLQHAESRAVDWRVLRPVKAASNLPLLTVQSDNSVFVSGDESKRDLYDLDFAGDGKPVTTIRLEVLPDDRLPAHGPGRVFYEGAPGDFFLSEVTATVDGKPVKITDAAASGGGSIKTTIDGDPQTGWNINGRQGQTTTAVFRLATPISGPFSLHLLFERYHAADLGRFRISAASDTRPVQADYSPEVEAGLLLPAASRTPAQQELILRQFIAAAPEFKADRDAIAALRSEMPPVVTTLTFQERPPNNPRLTYVHHRGEYLQRREQVTPGVIGILPPLPPGAPANRLAFARWLVSPTNPLTARVTMNRQWAAFFGKGIVRTLQDFGYQGEPPTHQELLDWLAVTFMRQGWSLKKMHKLIVMSATYRQSARETPELLAKDPENRLLGRAPRVRLEAEIIRDSVLAEGGLLSSKIGGPSVFPPQPPGITSEGTYGPLEWKVSEGEDRYRRGLYTFSKRTAPYAMFATFDAPSGEACVARRDVSNTPMQALTLLNNEVLVEAAQTLGSKIAALPGSDSERVVALFRRCLTRPPAPDEIAMMQRFVTAQKTRFDRDQPSATAVAGSKDGDVSARAVWTALARALLNLDEAVTRQ